MDGRGRVPPDGQRSVWLSAAVLVLADSHQALTEDVIGSLGWWRNSTHRKSQKIKDDKGLLTNFTTHEIDNILVF